jgi:catechol 2,3-dioxygenase-like lactoylglutathione lyase family enzyme
MEPRISIITLGVEDMARAVRFYRDGLGLPTSAKETDPIAFFKTSGVCLALYPNDKLAEDVYGSAGSVAPPEYSDSKGGANRSGEPLSASGITLAHNTRTQEEVDQLLAQAEAAGGKIEKSAQDTFWGGYSGYFSDPDGHLWEVAFSKDWKFNDDGSLVID